MKNARLSSRISRTIKGLSVLSLTVLLSGCFLFPETKKKTVVAPPVKPGAVSLKRTEARKASRTFVCLIAEQGKPFSVFEEENGSWQGAEPEIVRAIAAKLKLDVVFLPLPASALASALRNGRGDLAVGKLTTSQIALSHLKAVFPYAPARDGHYALMIRADDAAWENELKNASAGIDGSALIKANAQDLKPIAAKVVEKENSDEIISISAEPKKTKKKAPAGK